MHHCKDIAASQLQLALGRRYVQASPGMYGGPIEGLCEGFENCLNRMMVIVRSQQVNVEIEIPVVSYGAEKLGYQSNGKIADHGALKKGRHTQVRTPGQIDHYTGQRLIHRNITVRKALNSNFVTKSLFKGLSETNPNIFNCVMLVDV